MSRFLTTNKVWILYKWSLFIIVLESLKAWFFWDISNIFIIPTCFIFISIVVWILTPDFFSFGKKSTISIFLLYILAKGYTIGGTNLNGYIGFFITSSGVLLFAGLKDHYKNDFFTFFTRIFSILIFISLAGWIIYLLGTNLPSFYDTYGFSEQRNESQYFYQNFYVFLVNLGTRYSDLSNQILPRFSSVFLEPGYLGIILVILLYLNDFDLKSKYNIILLSALFFTFSLAGWLMGIIIYIFYILRNSNKRIITSISIVIFLWAFYTFSSTYKNGNNVVNQLIFTRLQYDESNATIAGYNRTSVQFDEWFDDYFLKSKDIIWGMNVKSIFGETTNVGWKVYMANYGLVGLSFYLLFLLYIFYKNKNYETFIFFFLFILIFARGHHIIYYSAFPILYLCGCSILKDTSQNE